MKNVEITEEDDNDLLVSHSKKKIGQDNDDDDAMSYDEENLSRSFPAAFYCPTTKKLFEQPVVVRDGNSYELSAVEGDYEPSSLYENRALQGIITEAKKNLTSSNDTNGLVTSLRKIQTSIRTNFSNLVDRSAFSLNWRGPLPDAYYCPITLDLMHDPVIDGDGTTYDRRAIVKWIRANGQSPFTRKDLTLEDLYPNKVILDLIQSELDKSDESMHSSIRKWKTQQQASRRDHSGDNENNGDYDDDDDISLPVTQEQIRERLQSRRGRLLHRGALCSALFVILYFVPYIGIMLIIIGIMLIIALVVSFICCTRT